MPYIYNLKKQWPLTANEKKWLDGINKEILTYQKGLRFAYLTKNKRLREQILWEIKNLSELRKKDMQRVWKRRRRALMGK